MDNKTEGKTSFKDFKIKNPQWIIALCTLGTFLFFVADRCSGKTDKELEKEPSTINIQINDSSQKTVKENTNANVKIDNRETNIQNDSQNSTHTTNNPQQTKGKKESIIIRLLTNAEIGMVKQVLLDNQMTTLISNLENVKKIVVPTIGESYQVSFVREQDTLRCKTIFVKENNQRIPIICN